jgi:predicted chitinase
MSETGPPTTLDDFTQLLRRVMDQLGMPSRSLRAGTAAICFGESGFHPQRESGYGRTSTARIREIFGRRVESLSDAEIDALKASDERFFNLIYGGEFGRTQLGNTEPGDGFRFIGRGPIQLTGRGNYAKYGGLIGVDLTKQPDLANEPEIGCKLAVVYMKDRYHGGGFDSMKRAVGNVVATTEAVKDTAFAKFMASGVFGGTEA